MDEATKEKITYFKAQERIFLDRALQEPHRAAEHHKSAEAWRRLAQFRLFLTERTLEKRKAEESAKRPPVDSIP